MTSQPHSTVARRADHVAIAQFINKAHDYGVMAGISSHVPEHIERGLATPRDRKSVV